MLAFWICAAAQTSDFVALSFDDALKEAIRNHGDVIRAKEDLVLVDVERMRAWSAIMPRVDLQASAGGQWAVKPVIEQRGTLPGVEREEFFDLQFPSYSNTSFGMGLNASQLLFDGGRWWTQIARVEDVAAARKAALSILTNDLRAQVAQRFYGYVVAEEAARQVSEQVIMDEAQLARAKALLEVGRGRSADVAAAARNLADDRTNLARQKFSQRQAARALNVLIGREPGTPVLLALEPSATTTVAEVPSVPTVERLLAEAEKNRPELVALAAEVAQGQKAVTVAQADYYPAISLGANYQRQSRKPSRTFGDPTENFFAGLSLVMRWNLFEGRATSARVQEAEVNLRKSESRKAELLRTVHSDVRDRLDNLQLQREVHGLAILASQAAEEAVRLARGLYEQGRGTLLELRDAELRMTQSRISVRTARLQLEIARHELYRAVGVDPFDLQ